jgi:group II intron reverse transcriptase/maturase/CRISPR-associated endonuclease Cas1
MPNLNPEFPPPFSKIRWHRVSLELVSLKPSSILKGHPVSVLEAVVKAATNPRSLTSQGMISSEAQSDPSVIFHLKNRPHTFKMRPLEKIPVEVLFLRYESTQIENWRQELIRYMGEGWNARTFELAALSQVEDRDLSTVKTDMGAIPEEGEMCLEFLSPYFFKPDPGKSRTFVSTEAFIKSLERRFSRLFGIPFSYLRREDDFHILPCYWDYTEVYHAAGSQPGHTQYINGCMGPLYIKGRFKELLPFILLGSEVHAGSKLSNGQGYYRVHAKSLPYFDARFPDIKVLRSCLRDTLEQNDRAREKLAREETYPLDENKLTESLFVEMQKADYAPSPSRAFKIPRDVGTDRLVEQMSVKDMVVARYVLRVLSPVFDRLFEEESIGFRKGLSRQKAVELVNSALAAGYQGVIETDIEDFFPSVDLDLLDRLLDDAIPASDVRFKSVLKAVIRSGFLLNGKVNERQRGLALGNPLSPILANLYLDSFDERVKALDLRLVRYADDFVVFCRTPQEAEKVLETAASFLSDLGLRLKKDKTALKSVEDGFQFLGMTFDGARGLVEPDEDLRLLKKPLYITEPYAFLALNGDALDIRKDQKTVESIPLRRVGEIMVMENAVFSTALLRRCIDLGIPLTVALNTGYFITTIKPDSKRYYSISSIHGQKYRALTDTEILFLSKSIVVAKLANYRVLFKHKYRPGSNVILKNLTEYITRAEHTTDMNELRGIEGWAARRVFEALNGLIDDPAFHLRERRRIRPDRINSLLNFGYYLLFSRINATIRASGLNPYLGFLHAPEDDYESLVSDLVELFRARVDRFILKLINLRIIGTGDFSESDRGFYLTRQGVHKYISRYETEMRRRPSGSRIPLIEEIYLQVHQLKKWACEDKTLSFYRWEQ